MNAYLFTAVSTVSQVRPNTARYGPAVSLQIWDSSSSLIVLGDNPDQTQIQFEAWLHMHPKEEKPPDIRIRKIAAAQFVDQLFTESGSAPLDWQKIVGQWLLQAETISVDDFEQGYWTDVDSLIHSEQPGINIETLQQNLPEDIQAGLNWSPEKQFIFVLSVLAPLTAPSELASGEGDISDSAGSPEENLENPEPIGLGELCQMFPGALDKETAALIQARNAVVAAWLWRKFAADTQFAANHIRIESLCGVMGLPETDEGTGPT